MATYSSILARKISLTEPGELLSMESQGVGHDWICTQSTHNPTTMRKTMKDMYILQGGFHDTFRTIYLEHLETKKAETIKILEERICSKLFGDDFFISDSQSKKSRNTQVGLY